MPERLGSSDPKKEISLQEKKWRLFREIGLKRYDVQTLLQREDFAQHIADALNRSTQERKITGEELMDLLLREGHQESDTLYRLQEHGFFAYSAGLSTDPIYLSPLIEGVERRVLMDHIDFDRSQEDSDPAEIPNIHVCFHTHAGGFRRTFEVRSDRNRLKRITVPNPILSPGDLKGMRRIANMNPGFIFIAGQFPYPSVRDWAKLLLVSFRSYHAWKDLRPDILFESASRALTTTGNILPVYNRAGLNAAVIHMDLEEQPVLDQEDVERASRILTRTK